RNRLVVIGKAGTLPLGSLGEMALSGGRIALADPALAPAGMYAKQSLEMSGLWDGLESRVIPTLDVRAAVGAVATGNAAFGLVYATDAAAVSGVEVVLVVPEHLHDAIVYPAAIIYGSNAGDHAMDFLEFLASEDAGAVFERHGFVAAAR
ncbi:MAG: molybdate ABC transporter substrate-binding protein, partial [Dehalococcoidia bacterium]|nr:molybdate ABC transporter substrate-binding protein [Dehalococcoidia bacterium]